MIGGNPPHLMFSLWVVRYRLSNRTHQTILFLPEVQLNQFVMLMMLRKSISEFCLAKGQQHVWTKISLRVTCRQIALYKRLILKCVSYEVIINMLSEKLTPFPWNEHWAVPEKNLIQLLKVCDLESCDCPGRSECSFIFFLCCKFAFPGSTQHLYWKVNHSWTVVMFYQSQTVMSHGN